MEEIRISYARQKLLNLTKEHKLRAWCLNYKLDYTLMHKIAIGTRIPTYRLMSSTCHIIPPAEWIFFTDETIPYQVQTVPQWDYNELSYYILKHKKDYKDIQKEYDLDELTAYNLFKTHRLYPSYALIRIFSEKVDPVEFFISSPADISDLPYPARGDVVEIENEQFLVLSAQEQNKLNKAIIGCKYDELLNQFNPLLIQGIKLEKIPPVIKQEAKDFVEEILNIINCYLK